MGQLPHALITRRTPSSEVVRVAALLAGALSASPGDAAFGGTVPIA